MKTVTGDLIALAEAGQFDVIVHGCNCFHAMGAGVAAAIASRYPSALTADKATDFGDAAKLGTISTVDVSCAGQQVYNCQLLHTISMARHGCSG